jgi:EAL domain-containing protein (putative c-di-GMP-specific phosphodiesterase class I)
VRLADIALYDAKRDGRSMFKAHSEHANAAAAQLSRIETDIKLGIVRNEFEVYYQPIVDAKTRLPRAAEALVRWSHPSKGLVFPGAFISIAEDLGLIVEIGRKVLEQACLDAKRWTDMGLPPIRVAVNVSPAQLLAGCLIEDVQNALKQSGFPAERLELEINENLFIEDYENATGILTELRNEGIQLAIDDFGTRYSSLARLQRLPVQRLKIDQSFVRSLHTDVDSATISNAIITLGKSLDLDIVAEGVEYEDQITFLRDHGCDELQGFLFAKPCPFDQFVTWMQEVQ